MDPVFNIADGTTGERRRHIATLKGAFMHYTFTPRPGEEAAEQTNRLRREVSRLRLESHCPVAVRLDVDHREQLMALEGAADAVVPGAALDRQLVASATPEEAVERVRTFMGRLGASASKTP